MNPGAIWAAAASMIALVALAGCSADAAINEVRACGRSPLAARPEMVAVPGGLTTIGSDRFGDEEGPVRTVNVGAFDIDRYEVTNAQFARFVAATGYITRAERNGAGGAVFASPEPPSGGLAAAYWWRLDPQASWRRPHGVGSKADPSKPVVQVTSEDAVAYARWRGHDLPTEEEWERAARGGLVNADYSWGDSPPSKTEPRNNHWQGAFPAIDTGDDGYRGLAPVGCFPANGFGLHDMAGNAWELTRSRWQGAEGAPGSSGVIKGGSWLCADNYCLRYRPAARQPSDPELGTDHIGFRTLRRSQGRQG